MTQIPTLLCNCTLLPRRASHNAIMAAARLPIPAIQAPSTERICIVCSNDTLASSSVTAEHSVLVSLSQARSQVHGQANTSAEDHGPDGCDVPVAADPESNHGLTLLSVFPIDTVRGALQVTAPCYCRQRPPNLPESPYPECNQEALGPWTVVAPPTGAVPFPPWTDGSAHH